MQGQVSYTQEYKKKAMSTVFYILHVLYTQN